MKLRHRAVGSAAGRVQWQEPLDFQVSVGLTAVSRAWNGLSMLATSSRCLCVACPI